MITDALAFSKDKYKLKKKKKKKKKGTLMGEPEHFLLIVTE